MATLPIEPTGARVLDLCPVSPTEWWLGWHRETTSDTLWPGGSFPEELPGGAISRGYLKIREGLAWAGFRPQPEERCVELGCAPGGASQALLDLGLLVVGVDPADVDERLLSHPRFVHIAQRSNKVPRKAFLGIDWLFSDINLPPAYTLDTVEGILEHPGVNFKGMLLTLKLGDWDLAAEIPAYLERIRSWQYAHVRARQLSLNRREICVAVS